MGNDPLNISIPFSKKAKGRMLIGGILFLVISIFFIMNDKHIGTTTILTLTASFLSLLMYSYAALHNILEIKDGVIFARRGVLFSMTFKILDIETVSLNNNRISFKLINGKSFHILTNDMEFSGDINSLIDAINMNRTK